MANVSWVCPTIHPDLAIAPEGTPGHSIVFRDAAATPRADEVDAARRAPRRPDRRTSCSGTRPRRGRLGASSAARLSRAEPASRRRAVRRATGATIARRAPLDDGFRTGGAPSETDPTAACRRRDRLRRNSVAERPHDPDLDRDFAHAQRLGPRVRDVRRLRPADLRRAGHVHEAAVGHRSGRAPPARASTSRSSARRSTTRSPIGRAPGSARARSARRSTRSGSINSLQLDVEPFEVLTVVDAGDANIVPAWIERGPRDDLPQGPRGRRHRRDPDRPRRRPLDHLAGAPPPSPRSAGRAASGSSISTPTPTPPTTTGASWPATARRCAG